MDIVKRIEREIFIISNYIVSINPSKLRIYLHIDKMDSKQNAHERNVLN